MARKKRTLNRTATKERRKYLRILAGCPMTFVTSKGKMGNGRLVDLSLRGLKFLTEMTFSKGEKLKTVFTLQNGIALNLAGVVKYGHRSKLKKWVYGVEFFIRDYHDLKEHLKLNRYIVQAHAEQDRMLREKLLK